MQAYKNMWIIITLQFSPVISTENMNTRWISSKLSRTRRQNYKSADKINGKRKISLPKS